MSTNHTPVDHTARIVPGKRGSTPRCIQAMSSVPDRVRDLMFTPSGKVPLCQSLEQPRRILHYMVATAIRVVRFYRFIRIRILGPVLSGVFSFGAKQHKGTVQVQKFSSSQ